MDREQSLIGKGKFAQPKKNRSFTSCSFDIAVLIDGDIEEIRMDSKQN